MVAGLAEKGVLVEGETVTTHGHHVARGETRVASASLSRRGIQEVDVFLKGICLHEKAPLHCLEWSAR